jgi:hypothetical protein
MDGLEHFHLAPPLICWMVLREPYFQIILILGLSNEMCNNYEGIAEVRIIAVIHNFQNLCIATANIKLPFPNIR